MEHQVLELDRDWAMRHCEAGRGEAARWHESGVEGPEAYRAEVPGDAHLDLARAGVIPEPLLGQNVADLGWMEERDWWYSTSFTPEADFLGDRMELVFHGLDTFADVWLNGTHLGQTRNAFVPHSFDVTHLVREGENLLVVRLDTGLRWAREQERERYRWPGDATMPERIWLRRAQFTGGWDWGPRLLTVGIWRPVELHSYRGLILRDVYLTARLLEEGRAVVQAQYEIESLADGDLQSIVELTLDGENGAGKRLEVTLAPGPNLIRDLLVLDWPRLWWPNGMGEQYLYDVRCDVCVGGQTLDSTEFSFGVREVSLVQEDLGEDEGQSFTFLVNGEPVFCKGANWVPADSIPARVTPEKYWALLEDAVEANFNMLRVWGGGIYEDDAWWDACDNLGLLVWQDFMFACSAIPDDNPGFAAQLEEEAGKVIRRLRNRASLALWCGNNENQWLSQRSAPHTTGFGRPTYHEMLPRLCAQLDPTRFYWPSSPWGGLDANSERLGDRHAWDIALNADLEVRTRYKAYTADRGKFISEYGFLAPPVEASLREFLPADEVRLGSPSWQLHENTFDRGVVRHVIRRYFGRDADELPLESFLLLAQAYQAEAYRYTLGHFRRRAPYCSGSLFWMYSDCWGATSGWTIVDYYLNRKPAYYAVRRAFAPVAISLIEGDNGLSLWMVNDRMESVPGVLEYGRGDLSNSDLEVLHSGRLTVEPGSSERLAHLVIPELSEQERRRRFYWARFTPTEGEPIQDVAFLTEEWFRLEWGKGELAWQVEALDGDDLEPGEERFRLLLSAEHLVWGLWLVHGAEVSVSDNYLTLLPGAPCEIMVTGPRESVEGMRSLSVSGLLGGE
ncbi:MAG: hypothetical protein HPY83_05140 [Anaerolineae bacterium]|nr:hypothetical protein [Anaerolineae bacterium]